MMYQVVGLLGIPLFETLSYASALLFCRKHDLDSSCIKEVKL